MKVTNCVVYRDTASHDIILAKFIQFSLHFNSQIMAMQMTAIYLHIVNCKVNVFLCVIVTRALKIFITHTRVFK